jgi:hypothetical protein
MGSMPTGLGSKDVRSLCPLLLLLCSLCLSEHIQKQIERGYAEKDAQLTFWPTNLGESLISSYRCGQLKQAGLLGCTFSNAIAATLACNSVLALCLKVLAVRHSRGSPTVLVSLYARRLS